MGGLPEKWFLPCCCIRDCLDFDMQYDINLEKVYLTFLPLESGGYVGKIFCIMLPHFANLFNLLCNMTML